MQGTVDGFSYGLVTPLVAYLMACLGGALGLRCTTRAMLVAHTWRPGWLALGSAAIGSGIWTMHFIAMIGFTVEGAPIHYDKPTTYASLAVAILMVGVGIFIVGYKGATGTALFTGARSPAWASPRCTTWAWQGCASTATSNTTRSPWAPPSS